MNESCRKALHIQANKFQVMVNREQEYQKHMLTQAYA
jgi:hypothetical protein